MYDYFALLAIPFLFIAPVLHGMKEARADRRDAERQAARLRHPSNRIVR